jgi:hypothetical protein
MVLSVEHKAALFDLVVILVSGRGRQESMTVAQLCRWIHLKQSPRRDDHQASIRV